MNRLRRTRILVEGDPALCATIAAQIEGAYSIEPVGRASEVLVMTKVRESAQNSLFYLGEVLAVECKVRLGQVSGYGLLVGSDAKRAYELAVIDAAFSGEQPLPEQAAWVELLEREECALALAARHNQEQIEQTRVEFATMLTADEQKAGA